MRHDDRFSYTTGGRVPLPVRRAGFKPQLVYKQYNYFLANFIFFSLRINSLHAVLRTTNHQKIAIVDLTQQQLRIVSRSIGRRKHYLGKHKDEEAESASRAAVRPLRPD